MRQLEKKIKDFTQHYGYGLNTVFDSLLDYIIWSLDYERKPLKEWRYKKEQSAEFYEMMSTYFSLLEDAVEKYGWYDAWGDLFMSMHPNGGDRGQFFTPDDICNLMTAISFHGKEIPTPNNETIFGRRIIISDCTAGSSRNLLSAHALFIDRGWRKPYLCAEDLDMTCCKMSAINLCVHGCFGEVVCHDTLTEPDKVNMGYIINESLKSGFPSIRRTDNPDAFISTRVLRKKDNRQPTQLTLW